MYKNKGRGGGGEEGYTHHTGVGNGKKMRKIESKRKLTSKKKGGKE
jgi:hypothetical protein